MLVLSRKLQEAVIIRGDIVVRILEVNREVVKLGIEAPEDVPVHRIEIHEASPPKRKRGPHRRRPPINGSHR